MLWFIEHHPEALGENPPSNLNARLDGEAYFEGKRLWEKQIAAHPNDVALLDHAASYLLLFDRNDAEALWKKAQQIDPGNPRWAERLAHLYALSSSSSGSDGDAKKAFAEMERANAASLDHFGHLDALAKMAFAAGDLEKARDYAGKLLADAPAMRASGTLGTPFITAISSSGELRCVKGMSTRRRNTCWRQARRRDRRS